MSAFVTVWHRDGMPGAVGEAGRMLDAMDHRGPDGSRCLELCGGSVSLGHQHHWTTPEAVGEIQPIDDGALTLAFDGRLDNRTELGEALGINSSEVTAWSDARMVLAAYERWGEHVMSHLVGPCALTVWDEGRRQMLLGRDRLGSRVVAFALSPSSLVVASEPSAVLEHADVADRLDDESVACLLAAIPPDGSRTLFADVHLVPPGHTLLATEDDHRLWRYWRPDLTPLRLRSDDDYAERFAELLRTSVTRRARAHGNVGVQMSGGLDSTAVAAMLVEVSDGDSGRVPTVSYVFDRFPECDERPFIHDMIDMLDLDASLASGDEAWTLRDAESWPHDPSGPTSPYAELLNVAHCAAKAAGVRVLLNGYGGDEVYAGLLGWLADLVADGRKAEAWRELSRHVRHTGVMQALKSRSVRRASRRLLGLHEKATEGHTRPTWLTDRGWELAQSAASSMETDPSWGRCWPGAIGGTSFYGRSGTYRTAVPGIEMRSPFRDVDLVSFMASIPAHQLYNRGRPKHVVRHAMRGRLPETVRNRVARTSFTPLVNFGLTSRADLVTSLLENPSALWRTIVHPEALRIAKKSREAGTGLDQVMLWYCVSLELWRRRSLGLTLQ